LPLPRVVEPRAGTLELVGTPRLDPPPGFASPALDRLRTALAELPSGAEPGPRVRLVLDGRAGHPREGYELELGPREVRLVASRGAGLNHGMRTLVQLLRLFDGPRPVLPALWIRDAPAFERRGVMLDVSRDRVPRMDSLLALVERLASWKLNELQLYFEHAFAYRDHERVWRGVDPFTPDEVRALDRHCAAHGIELVPNQQSFGHLHHWLKHAEYAHLAEVPEGIVHPFLAAGTTAPEPFSLCPTDPRSLEFLGGLYDELLPCFASGELNVGLDETIDLGPGRSAEAVRARGVGRVYLEFLQRVHDLVTARGKRMQFWADILLHHPQLVSEVPRDAVAMLWGYEADHPFEQETHTLAEAGLDFAVCPGTSSWQSVGGRLENMQANVRSAARWGSARGARGLLVTDWGDRGHLQPPFASWPGFLTAADAAWNPEAATPERHGRIEELLALHLATPDPAPLARAEQARPLVDLARIARVVGTRARNASPLSLLLTKFDAPFPPPELEGLDADGLDAAESVLARGSRAGGSGLLERELAWAAELLGCACALGRARLEAGDGRPLPALDGRVRGALGERLGLAVRGHRELWLERSRPGGLDRSARWLERVLEALRG